jgi:hypothetical protein
MSVLVDEDVKLEKKKALLIAILMTILSFLIFFSKGYFVA